MIARHGGHVALFGARPQRGLIDAVGRAKGGPDLGEGTEARHLFVVEEQILRARLRPHALPLRLRALDALEAEARREMDDVDRALRELSDEDGAIDRLLLRPIGTGGREVRGRCPPFRDGFVLEVTEDVAVLAVELTEAAQSTQDV